MTRWSRVSGVTVPIQYTYRSQRAARLLLIAPDPAPGPYGPSGRNDYPGLLRTAFRTIEICSGEQPETFQRALLGIAEPPVYHALFNADAVAVRWKLVAVSGPDAEFLAGQMQLPLLIAYDLGTDGVLLAEYTPNRRMG